METLVTFSLGAGTVLIILGVVVVVKLVKQVRLLERQVTDIQIVTNQNEEMLNRRIDQEIDRTNQIINQLTDSIYSTIDSRLDKLEAKVTKEKQLIKG